MVGAIIDPGNCLDLSEDSSLEIYKRAYSVFKDYFETIDQPIPRNEPGFRGDEELVRRKLDTVRCLIFCIFCGMMKTDLHSTP